MLTWTSCPLPRIHWKSPCHKLFIGKWFANLEWRWVISSMAHLCLRMVTSLMLTSQCCIHLVLGSILGYLNCKHLRLIATWTDNKSHNVTHLWKSWLQACDHKPLPLTPHTFHYRSVDQCTDGTDNCDANAMCTDTTEGFTCTCNNGFTGDGVTCSKWQLMLISDMVIKAYHIHTC